jgi:SM-20-related protein
MGLEFCISRAMVQVGSYPTFTDGIRSPMTDTPATRRPIEPTDHTPFHGIIENWLGSAAIQRLLHHIQANENLFKLSTIESGAIDASHRRSRRLSFSGSLAADFRLRALALLPDIISHLHIDPFTPTEVELEVAAHGDGDFFSTHVDSKKGTPRPRVISAVYYFHRIPRVFSGGNLCIYSPAENDRQRSAFVEVPPENDSLVFFPAWLPHEVTRITSESRRIEDCRLSINCWFHGN